MSGGPIVPCLWFDDQAQEAAGLYTRTLPGSCITAVSHYPSTEVDRYWAALSRAGSQGPCGWLKDRFGPSWQVVPTGMGDSMTSGDGAARDRAFRAMLGMKQLDVAALRAAFAGT